METAANLLSADGTVATPALPSSRK